MVGDECKPCDLSCKTCSVFLDASKCKSCVDTTKFLDFTADAARTAADSGTCVAAASCATGPDAYDGVLYIMATYGTAVGSTIV